LLAESIRRDPRQLASYFHFLVSLVSYRLLSRVRAVFLGMANHP
jgi:hypothetical protein